jgi:prepilin peptidase CpaA
MWLRTLWMYQPQPLLWGVVITASLAAAAFDLKSRRIPNWLTGPVFLGGLVWATVAGGLAGLADSTVGALVMMFPFVVLFLFAGGGAGDAKLMAALGAWLGLVNGLFALGAILAAGAVLALCYALLARRLREVGRNLAGMVLALWCLAMGRGRIVTLEQARQSKPDPKTRMPYGLAVLVGALAAAIGVFLWRRAHGA